MLQTVEGVIDRNGNLRLMEPIQLPRLHRVIITILNEELPDESVNLALLSEPALARDWERPEEEQAWSHLVQLPSL